MRLIVQIYSVIHLAMVAVVATGTMIACVTAILIAFWPDTAADRLAPFVKALLIRLH